MTPDELKDIRARDAAAYDVMLSRTSARAITEMRADRRALLAEVDRLTAELRTIPPDVHVWALAEDVERARIRAGVEGLAKYELTLGGEQSLVDRAAVLHVIDGGGG